MSNVAPASANSAKKFLKNGMISGTPRSTPVGTIITASGA
jgi:hypothetical protein